MEWAILELAREHDMVVLGPNGNGFVNVVQQILPYGLPIQPPLVKGPVGVVLQSGALASTVIMLAQARHIGLSLLVSMGNEMMMSATDAMDYLIEDDETRVLAVFLESIRQPATFERLAHKARERNKPIVALKVGRSEISARAAKAHTGALVGNDAINDAAFKQLGIVRVESMEDLLITAGLLGIADLCWRDGWDSSRHPVGPAILWQIARTRRACCCPILLPKRCVDCSRYCPSSRPSTIPWMSRGISW